MGTFSPTSPLLLGVQTSDYYGMASELQVEAVATLLLMFGTCVSVLVIIKVKILVVIWIHMVMRH